MRKVVGDSEGGIYGDWRLWGSAGLLAYSVCLISSMSGMVRDGVKCLFVQGWEWGEYIGIGIGCWYVGVYTGLFHGYLGL